MAESLKKYTDNELAERRNEIRSEISAIKRQDDLLRAERDDIDSEFKRRFSKRGITGVKAGGFNVFVKADDHYPEMSDKAAFNEFIIKYDKLYLLQQRLAQTNIKDEQIALDEEKKEILELLEEKKWSQDACISVLDKLHEEDTKDIDDDDQTKMDTIYDTCLELLKKTNRVKDYTKELLDQRFRIPGVDFVQKLTVNQTKI